MSKGVGFPRTLHINMPYILHREEQNLRFDTYNTCSQAHIFHREEQGAKTAARQAGLSAGEVLGQDAPSQGDIAVAHAARLTRQAAWELEERRRDARR